MPIPAPRTSAPAAMMEVLSGIPIKDESEEGENERCDLTARPVAMDNDRLPATVETGPILLAFIFCDDDNDNDDDDKELVVAFMTLIGVAVVDFIFSSSIAFVASCSVSSLCI